MTDTVYLSHLVYFFQCETLSYSSDLSLYHDGGINSIRRSFCQGLSYQSSRQRNSIMKSKIIFTTNVNTLKENIYFEHRPLELVWINKILLDALYYIVNLDFRSSIV